MQRTNPTAVKEVEAPCAGIRRLVLPLPYEVQTLNVYLLEGEGGSTVVDTGVGGPFGRATWGSVFEHLAPASISALVGTHYHPDHIGAAGWLAAKLDVPFLCSQVCWLVTKLLLSQDQSDQEEQLRFFRRLGTSSEDAEVMLAAANGYKLVVDPPPPAFFRLRDGAEVRLGGRTWRVCCCEGHASELVTLYSEELGVLLCSDQVLPEISPNVSVWSTSPEDDPLGAYLASLARLRELPDETLCLPAHGEPFRGLRRRVDELVEHHRLRLQRIVEALEERRTVAALVDPVFTPGLGTFERMFAQGELQAHLALLLGRGEIEREEDERGTWWYARKR